MIAAAGRLNTAADGSMPTSDSNFPAVNCNTVNVPTPFQFYYADEKKQMKYWCIPKSFQFPSGATRGIGWRKWLMGSVHVDGITPWNVKPYHLLKESDLKSKSLELTLRHEGEFSN